MSVIEQCYNPEIFSGDLAPLTGSSLPEPTYVLETLIYTALFTDARVTFEEAIQAGLDGSCLGGHWADIFYPQSFGSKLWLLKRAKNTTDTHRDAKQYAEQALKHFITAGYVTAIKVETGRHSKTAMFINVIALLPDGSELKITKEFNFASV